MDSRKFNDLVISQSDISRFWSKVDKSNKSKCWEWTGAKNSLGYGKFGITHGRIIKAHRFSLFLMTGEWSIKHALHSCNNPSCVNPSHLRWGVHQENMNDYYGQDGVKERYAKAMFNISQSRRKLLPSQALYMKKLLDAGFSIGQCAEWYCVGRKVASNVKNGKYDQWMMQ